MRAYRSILVSCDRCLGETLEVETKDSENIEMEIEEKMNFYGWKCQLDENEDLVDICPKCAREMEKSCNLPAKFTYYWPGDPARHFICATHALKLEAIAENFGLHGILQEAKNPRFRCQQEVSHETGV